MKTVDNKEKKPLVKPSTWGYNKIAKEHELVTVDKIATHIDNTLTDGAFDTIMKYLNGELDTEPVQEVKALHNGTYIIEIKDGKIVVAYKVTDKDKDKNFYARRR